jgi:ADP-ribosylglycohydrolase
MRKEMVMKDNAKAMVMGSFVADALSLGVHWVYNTRVIDKKFGRVETYYDPLTSYHKGKHKGDFTHYGDQTLVLLKSVAACSGLDKEHFAESWRSFFETYDGYFDQATKATLQNMVAGKSILKCGSDSDDLGGASRIAPLCYAYHTDMEKLIETARFQTALTHHNANVLDSAEFFARLALNVLSGRKPSVAITEITNTYFKNTPIEESVYLGIESKSEDTRAVIAEFGQACGFLVAFPSTIHLIVKYEDNLKEALIENVMAGGDSSSRGMLVGMVLGAYAGLDAIPEGWQRQMNEYDRIENLLGQIS